MDLAPPNLIGFTLKRTSAKCSKNQPHRLRVLSTLIHTTSVQTSFVDNPRLVYAALPALSESHKTIAPKEDVEHTCASRCRCASGCVVECRICNWEVAGSNLGLGYFTPRSTQPSIPPGSVNEYKLWLGRQRQLWLIPIADERVDVQVKL